VRVRVLNNIGQWQWDTDPTHASTTTRTGIYAACHSFKAPNGAWYGFCHDW